MWYYLIAHFFCDKKKRKLMFNITKQVGGMVKVFSNLTSGFKFEF